MQKATEHSYSPGKSVKLTLNRHLNALPHLLTGAQTQLSPFVAGKTLMMTGFSLWMCGNYINIFTAKDPRSALSPARLFRSNDS